MSEPTDREKRIANEEDLRKSTRELERIAKEKGKDGEKRTIRPGSPIYLTR